jgi:hypothetical protein
MTKKATTSSAYVPTADAAWTTEAILSRTRILAGKQPSSVCSAGASPALGTLYTTALSHPVACRQTHQEEHKIKVNSGR